MSASPGASQAGKQARQTFNRALRAEQNRLLYANSSLAVFVTLFAAGILARLQWSVIRHAVVLTWLGYMVIVTLGRLALEVRYRKAHDHDNTRKWGLAFMIGVVFGASGWGAAGLVLYPEGSLVNQVFLAFVLGGMMVGAASVLAARVEAFAVFIVLSGLPTALRLFAPGDDVHIAMGLLALLYTVATLITARRVNATICTSLDFEFQNRDLATLLNAEAAERRLAAAAVEKSEHRLELALFAADMGLWDWNVETGEIFWDAQWSAIIGYAVGELTPTLDTWQQLVHPEDRDAVVRAVQEHLAGLRSYYQSEHRMLTKEGEWKWVLARGRIVERGAAGQPLRMTGTHRDVTVRRQTEDELRQARETLEVRVAERTAELNRVVKLLTEQIGERQRAEQERDRAEGHLRNVQKLEALGILAGGVAHDFNNILTSIIGYSQLAQDAVSPGSPAHGSLMQVMAAGNRAADLVRRLLVFSRKREQPAKLVDIAAEVADALQLLRASIPPSIEFQQQLESGCGYVLADPGLIHQVVMNLCTNAYQAMKGSPGSLEVTLSPVELDRPAALALGLSAGSYVKLSVRDSGTGIPPEIAGRIFEPFFTTKEVGEGTGLGLSIVHGVVTGCGGTASFESKPGEFTSFYVYLPRAASEPTEAKAAGTTPGGSGHILFVDDEPSIVGLATLMLQNLGYRVTGTTSSVEALELFREAPDQFDMVVSDFIMPKMTGEELVEGMRVIRPELPVLLISGFHDTVTTKADLPKTLRKPFSQADLGQAIHALMGERAQGSANG